MIRSILLLGLAALPACVPTPESGAEIVVRPAAAEPAPASGAYLIRGAPRANWSPGWAAVIRDGRLLLDSPTSAGWYAISLPAPRVDGSRRSHVAAALTLTVEPGACALPALRPRLPDGISLEWDSGRFEGCGGPRPATGAIAGTSWELVRIGADQAPAGRSPAAVLMFGAGGGLGGTLACNDGGIRRRWTDAGGFAGRAVGFEQTAMGCNDPAGQAFGMRFWTGMMTATAWRRDGERLFVTFADSSEAELRYLL